MNYCSNCGQRVIYQTPPGDDRARYCCESCGVVHYQNPKMVVGCIPEAENQILLCRRAIEPCYGKWTLPAGYLENGETVADGAKREAYEEALARVEILAPYALYNICYVNQIYLMFRARLKDHNYRAGTESLEVKLFSESDIPWDDIAFRVVHATLSRYYDDRRIDRFSFFMGNIEQLPPTTGETRATSNDKL
jgi:ADP-ribose pyrophosphatase YjhB (NUDIX family)